MAQRTFCLCKICSNNRSKAKKILNVFKKNRGIEQLLLCEKIDDGALYIIEKNIGLSQ